MQNYEGRPGMTPGPVDAVGGEPLQFEPEPPLAVIEVRRTEYGMRGRREYAVEARSKYGLDAEDLERLRAITSAAEKAAKGTDLMEEPRVFGELRTMRAMIEGDYEEPGIVGRLERVERAIRGPEPEPHNFVGRKDRACRACGKKFGEGAHVLGVPAKGGRS